jgi:arginyl-tRNA--protein-N-Asp/Glu arginylyltransferase
MASPSILRFQVVHDSEEPCPYLEGQVARLPLRLAESPRIPPEAFDVMLEQGDRRSGPFFYRTTCRSCVACEPIRVPVARFAPTKSQRRVARRADERVEVLVARPTFSQRHLEIYNRHKLERGLSTSGDAVDRQGYRLHLLESPLDTREIRYLVEGKLVAFSIVDFGVTSCSSVYHCFDPDYSELSLGVYSVLKEISYCASLGVEWYYLGLYVAQCKALRYKASYYPHQRKVNGSWVETLESSS